MNKIFLKTQRTLNLLKAKFLSKKAKTEEQKFKIECIERKCTHCLSQNDKRVRELTECEKNVNFTKLQETFDEEEQAIEEQIQKELESQIEEQESFVKRAIKTGVLLLLLKRFSIDNKKISSIIGESSKNTIEKAKQQAIEEIAGVKKKISDEAKKLIEFKSLILADEVKNRINTVILKEVEAGVRLGLTAEEITKNAINKAKEESAIIAKEIKDTVIAEQINEGRREAFEENFEKIHALQRTEILDSKICDMCLALDGRVVKQDDPMAQLNQVHDRCRGIWTPVLQVLSGVAPITGIPQTLQKRFDLVGGKPIANNFKQFKVTEKFPIRKDSPAYKALEKGGKIGRRQYVDGKILTPSQIPKK